MYKRILVAVDGSDTANRGLSEAIKLAKDQKAQLRLLHVVDQIATVHYAEAATYATDMLRKLEEQGRNVLDRAQAQARKRELKTTAVLDKEIGPVADGIVRQAKTWHADLIVLGTHGRRGISRLVMGSDAEAVVQSAPVPVLLVRAPARAKTRRRRR